MRIVPRSRVTPKLPAPPRGRKAKPTDSYLGVPLANTGTSLRTSHDVIQERKARRARDRAS